MPKEGRKKKDRYEGELQGAASTLGGIVFRGDVGLKHYDCYGDDPLLALGVPRLLNEVPRGDDVTNRIGGQITMRSVEVRLAYRNTESLCLQRLCRALVIYDRAPNGEIVTVNEFLCGTGYAADIVAPYNLDNSRRFSILWDDTISIAPGGCEGSMVSRHWSRALRHPVQFTKISFLTNVDIISGSLFLYVISTKPVAAMEEAPRVQYFTRIRYSDS